MWIQGESRIYDSAGHVGQRCPAAGYSLIQRDAALPIRVLELHSSTSPIAYFCLLNADGSMQRGPALPGFYTSYPILTTDQQTVFWRAGVLQVVDSELKSEILVTGGTLADDPRAWFTRLLLLSDGTLACAISVYQDDVFSAELVLVRSKFRLAEGWWPRGEGNPGGNPVLRSAG